MSLSAKVVLVSLFIAVASTASTLDQVRSALGPLDASEPVTATMTIEQKVKSEGRYANASTARAATVEIRHDDAGIAITIPQSLIDKARQKRWSKDVGENVGQDSIGAVRTLSVVEALNFRDALLAMLDGATLVSEKPATYGGRAARLLVLKLAAEAHKPANSIQLGSVKKDDVLTLWIGADNLPLAGERAEKTIGGFMFIHGTYESHYSYVFTHAHRRLLLTRLEVTDGGSGMGQNVSKKSVESLVLR